MQAERSKPGGRVLYPPILLCVSLSSKSEVNLEVRTI